MIYTPKFKSSRDVRRLLFRTKRHKEPKKMHKDYSKHIEGRSFLLKLNIIVFFYAKVMKVQKFPIIGTNEGDHYTLTVKLMSLATP